MTLPIPSYLDRKKLIWSFTNLNTYRNCPFQFQQRYVTHWAPFIGTAATEAGTRAHEAMERRASKQKIPLPDDLKNLEPFAAALDHLPPGVELLVEQQLAISTDGQACGFYDDKVFLRGKVDVLLFNREQSRALIWDWKTGRVWDNDPLELGIFACLAQKKFGIKHIDGQFIWLKDAHGPGKTHPLSDTAGTWAKVVRIINDIEQDLARGGDFYKKQSPLCPHCSARHCEFNPKHGMNVP